MRFLLAGDSHVRHIMEHVCPPPNQNPEFNIKWANMKFPTDEAVFESCSIGGCRIRDLLPGSLHPRRGGFAAELDHTIKHFKPHGIFLFIGTNDIGRQNESPYELALRLYSTATTLKNRYISVRFFAITQILPQYPEARGNTNSFNAFALEVNEHLLNLCREADRSMFFARVNILFPSQSSNSYWQARELFKDDGVHLNHLGVKKFLFRFRPTVIIALLALRH